jgi:hypothetical protein
MLVWGYIDIACMFGKCIMGYEYFIYSIAVCLDFSILSVCPQYFKCIFLAFAYL